MNNYDKRIQQLEDQVSKLTSLLSGKGKIVNFGKEFHVDKTIKLSDIVSTLENIKGDIEILKEKIL